MFMRWRKNKERLPKMGEFVACLIGEGVEKIGKELKSYNKAYLG